MLFKGKGRALLPRSSSSVRASCVNTLDTIFAVTFAGMVFKISAKGTFSNITLCSLKKEDKVLKRLSLLRFTVIASILLIWLRSSKMK